MKNLDRLTLKAPLHSLALSALGSLVFVCAANAQVLFSDNFSTSAQSNDVNFEYSGTRQGGTLGPLQYRQGNGSLFGTINGTIADEGSNGGTSQVTSTALQLGGSTGNQSYQFSSVSPEHNFNTALAAGQSLSISFKLNPAFNAPGSGDWGALTLGASDNAAYGASGSGARGQSVLNTATNVGVLFRENGTFAAFDGGNGAGSGTYSSSTGNHNIQFLISGTGAFSGGSATIQAFADGSTTPFFTYSKTGFTDDFLTLMGYSGANGGSLSDFDDFQVAVVPEPATWAAGLLSLGALGYHLRRRLSGLFKGQCAA